MKNQSQGDLQTPNEGQDVQKNINNQLSMSLVNLNLKSTNQLNTVVPKDNVIKQEEIKNDSEIFAESQLISC